MIKFTNYEDFCAAFHGTEEERQAAEILFMIRNNFSILQKLDNLDSGFVTFDNLIENWETFAKTPTDYLNSAIQKMSKVFDRIVSDMRNKIQRENVLLPIYKANEFNGKSIAWLSRRSGRTVREKLSGTRSVMAVKIAFLKKWLTDWRIQFF